MDTGEILGIHRPIVPLPKAVAFATVWAFGKRMHDVILTWQEVGALMRRPLHSPKRANSTTQHDIKLELDVRSQALIEKRLRSAFPDVAMTQCEHDVCNLTHARCDIAPIADGQACDDGLFCTVDEPCTGGICGNSNFPCPRLTCTSRIACIMAT